MRGLTVVAGCNDYMDNRLEEVKRLTARQVRAGQHSAPLLAISRVRHHLEGIFCLFGKQNKSDSPRSGTGGKRYRDAQAAMFGRTIDGKGQKVSRRIGQEEEIYPASVCPFNP